MWINQWVLNCHNLKSEIIKRILHQNIKKLYLFAICSMYEKRNFTEIITIFVMQQFYTSIPSKTLHRFEIGTKKIRNQDMKESADVVVDHTA